jgi:hypothetical protein
MDLVVGIEKSCIFLQKWEGVHIRPIGYLNATDFE